MKWLERWRESRKVAKQRSAPAQESPPTSIQEHVSVGSILTEIERNRLEYEKLASETRIAELKATAEDRKDERDYQRKLKEEDRERKRKAAADMRQRRADNPNGYKKKGTGNAIPAGAANCVDCIALMTTGSVSNRASTRDMIRHATERHEAMFFQPPGAAN
jgi:hypothetical protein